MESVLVNVYSEDQKLIWDGRLRELPMVDGVDDYLTLQRTSYRVIHREFVLPAGSQYGMVNIDVERLYEG